MCKFKAQGRDPGQGYEFDISSVCEVMVMSEITQGENYRKKDS